MLTQSRCVLEPMRAEHQSWLLTFKRSRRGSWSRRSHSITAAGNRRNLPQEGWRASATLTKVALAPFKHHKTSVMAAADWHQSPGQTNGSREVFEIAVGGSEAISWGDQEWLPGVTCFKAPTRGAGAVVRYLFFFLVQHHLCQDNESAGTDGQRAGRQYKTWNRGKRSKIDPSWSHLLISYNLWLG